MNIKLVLVITFSLLALTVKADNGEYIVTGTKTPVEAYKFPFSSTVITRDDIEKLQAKSMEELLSSVAGIDVTNQGGYGKTTSVRIRGAEADHVLVVIDGVRVGSATTGVASFQFIPVDLIERVEIIRGPRSSLWGSDAIGGVIQIFTRKGSEKKRYSASIGLGTEDTYKTTGATSGIYNNFYYSGSVNYFDTTGIDSRNSTTDAKSFDRDGYDNLSFSLRGGYKFNNGAEFDVFALQSTGNTEFDSTSRDETDFRQRVLGSTLSFSPLHFWDIKFRLSESRDEQITIDTVTPIQSNNFFKTKRRLTSIQNDFHINKNHLLVLGLDYQDDKINSTTSYAERARDNYAIYTQYLAEIGKSQISASIRTDQNEAFGNEVTGGAGFNYHFDNGISFYASYGTAFKAPTFNELYFPNFGSAGLQPETSESYEAGFNGFYALGEWAVRAYHTEIDNLIASSEVTPGTFRATNVNNARILGVETELTFNWENWSSSLTIDLLEPEDESIGKRLTRRSKQNLSYNLNYNEQNWSIGGQVRAHSDRYNNTNNTVRVNGFVTADMFAEYRFNENFSLRSRVGNLLDKDYQTVDTYNSLGRNVFFSLHYENL